MISCLSLALDLVLALQFRVPTENASLCGHCPCCSEDLGNAALKVASRGGQAVPEAWTVSDQRPTAAACRVGHVIVTTYHLSSWPHQLYSAVLSLRL